MKWVDHGLSHARLLSLLSYDPETGAFWRRTNTGGKNAGTLCGGPHIRGYWIVAVDGHTYLAHRLAWFYMRATWPPEETDHIDGDKRNNSFANLRCATSSENKANLPVPPSNSSGFKGVSWHSPRRKWRARVKQNGKERHLGLFATREAAQAVYAAALINAFGEFARLA